MTTSISAYRIPQHLDDPEKLGFWTIDEAGAFLLPLIMGIVGKMFLIGFIAGVAATYVLKKAKGSEQGNVILYSAYWFLSQTLNLRFTPPSYKRLLVG